MRNYTVHPTTSVHGKTLLFLNTNMERRHSEIDNDNEVRDINLKRMRTHAPTWEIKV
jgi:hypothetical protein